MKVLLQMRPNALTQRGGDTVVMERVYAGLNSLGVHTDVDLEEKADLTRYDLVHLFNFCTPEITEKLARRCAAANVPYLATTMYEDWPSYFSQMIAFTQALFQYVGGGQPAGLWPQLEAAARQTAPAPIQDNTWSANHAELLLASGDYEARALRRHYPEAKAIGIYRCGSEIVTSADNGALFRQHTGLDEYILCVGRLETRKNQLMLLKALEQSELPLIFITGGFSYQPDYEKACRLFRRRGKTLFLGRIDPALLASAFAGAAAHVLPSWCELPGIVSLEAARYGTRVVATDYGTIKDYLGDGAFYCKPDSTESIAQTIYNALQQPKNKQAFERAQLFTWEENARRHKIMYEEILDARSGRVKPANIDQTPEIAVLSYPAASPGRQHLLLPGGESLSSVSCEIVDLSGTQAGTEGFQASVRAALAETRAEVLFLSSADIAISPTTIQEHVNARSQRKTIIQSPLIPKRATRSVACCSLLNYGWFSRDLSFISPHIPPTASRLAFCLSVERPALEGALAEIPDSVCTAWGLLFFLVLRTAPADVVTIETAPAQLLVPDDFNLLEADERAKAKDLSRLLRSGSIPQLLDPGATTAWSEELARERQALQSARHEIVEVEKMLGGKESPPQNSGGLVQELGNVAAILLELAWREELVRPLFH